MDADLRCPVRTRHGRPASLSPASLSHARSRAHQTPFCARGLQKIIAVSENAPGAHGIVPRYCSTALFHARGGDEHRLRRETSATKPPPRNLHSEAPAAEQPLRHSPRRNAKAANSAATASAARPPPRNPRREAPGHAAPAAQPLPRREEQQGQTGEQHREIHSLVLDVIFLEEQRSEDESDHDAAAPYHRDDREQRPLILDRIEIECV